MNGSSERAIRASRRREKRESRKDIYNFLNSVIFTESGKYRKKRGTYRKTAVNGRIQQFLNSFEEMYPVGSKISKRELEYWIKRFELANDWLAVRQYLERFVMHGYFSVHNGCFIFEGKNPRQPTLKEIMNVQHKIAKLKIVTSKRRRRRAW